MLPSTSNSCKTVTDVKSEIPNDDKGKLSVLVLLHLSAVFDTVNHRILLERLENWVWFSGMVLKLFRSDLDTGGYDVSIGDHKSEWTSITCRVSQGLFCICCHKVK